MEKYEKKVGLKTVWMTIVRRWKIISLIFVPAVLITFLITQVFIPENYQSNATLLNDTNLTSASHDAIRSKIQNETILGKASQYLEANYSISLTSSNILNGLSFTPFNSSNAGIVKFSYSSKTKSLVKPVVESVSNVAVEELKASGYSNIKISLPANDPVPLGKRKQYLLIGLAASAILGLGIAFVDEIISDEVYDEEDVLLLGSPSYGLLVGKK